MTINASGWTGYAQEVDVELLIPLTENHENATD
jgi:hypothetical protein